MKRSTLSVYLRLRQRQNTLSLTSQGCQRAEQEAAGTFMLRNIFAIKHALLCSFLGRNGKPISSTFPLSRAAAVVNRVAGCDFKDRIFKDGLFYSMSGLDVSILWMSKIKEYSSTLGSSIPDLDNSDISTHRKRFSVSVYF